MGKDIERRLARLRSDPAWIAGQHHPEVDALCADADGRATAIARTALIAAIALTPTIVTLTARFT